MGGDVNVNIFYPRGSPHPARESVKKNVTEIPTLNHIYLWSRQIKYIIAQAPGSYPTPTWSELFNGWDPHP